MCTLDGVIKRLRIIFSVVASGIVGLALGLPLELELGPRLELG